MASPARADRPVLGHKMVSNGNLRILLAVVRENSRSHSIARGETKVVEAGLSRERLELPEHGLAPFQRRLAHALHLQRATAGLACVGERHVHFLMSWTQSYEYG